MRPVSILGQKNHNKTLWNQNSEKELKNCKNCRIGDCEWEHFLLKLRNQGMRIVVIKLVIKF